MDGASRPLLAFSTLACPEWDAEAVVARAAAFGYDAIEWRGGPEGTVRTAWDRRRRAALRDAMDRSALQSVAVTAYTNLISGDVGTRRQSARELVRHAELAADLGAVTVRAFLGARDDEASRDELASRAVETLESVLDAVAAIGVGIAIEPHDDHVRASDVRPILEALPHAALGVVWDIANAWSAGEAPEAGLAAYGGRIRYVQVKDGVGLGASWRLTSLGEGEVPLEDAIARLTESATSSGLPVPPVSVEWERAWHPELDPADVALPAALAYVLRLLSPSDETLSVTELSR